MRKGSISKFLKRIISTALALSVATVPVLSVAPTLNVYAVDIGYNTDGSNGGSNTVSGTGSGGVSVNKTGVIFYCLNSETGKVLSKYTFFSYNIKNSINV